MTTARQQVREAVTEIARGWMPQDQADRAADAASDVWEPLVRDVYELVAYWSKQEPLHPESGIAQWLRRAKEALNG